MPQPWAQVRSQLALATRYERPEQELDVLRRDLRAARLADAIEKAVNAAPSLTIEQRARLARLLLPSE
jgi:hypothetical protein